MQGIHFSRVRIVIGLALLIVGLVSLGMIFSPQGLRIPVDNRPLLVLALYAPNAVLTFGAWLFSGYPIKRFLAPFLVATIWIFFFILPILLLPLSNETIILVISFSSLLLVLLYGSYTRRREKHGKDAKKESKKS
jgi:hypothetical protein